MLDERSSHIDYYVVQFCDDNNILFFCWSLHRMQNNQQIENVGHSLFSLSQVYNDAPGIRMKISQISNS